jgi:hypothetical protein
MPVAVADGASSKIHWTQSNHLGTPVVTTDAGGAIVAPSDYGRIGFAGMTRLRKPTSHPKGAGWTTREFRPHGRTSKKGGAKICRVAGSMSRDRDASLLDRADLG